MKEEFAQLQQKIDSLNQREQLLVFFVVAAIVVMLFQLLLIDPVNANRKAVNAKIKILSDQKLQQENELQIINAQLTAGVNRNKIKQKNALQLELSELKNNIEQSVVAMIPPQLMSEVLEQLLSKTDGLKLISLENMPVKAVIEQQDLGENTDQQVAQALYNHGFILRLSGSYMSAIKYFDSLAELPWRFYWDDMKYQVDSYPNAIITLKVHTVSMSEEWIGV